MYYQRYAKSEDKPGAESLSPYQALGMPVLAAFSQSSISSWAAHAKSTGEAKAVFIFFAGKILRENSTD